VVLLLMQRPGLRLVQRLVLLPAILPTMLILMTPPRLALLVLAMVMPVHLWQQTRLRVWVRQYPGGWGLMG
jgi:hypothetical protein